jgi:hypothetical protein
MCFNKKEGAQISTGTAMTQAGDGIGLKCPCMIFAMHWAYWFHWVACLANRFFPAARPSE